MSITFNLLLFAFIALVGDYLVCLTHEGMSPFDKLFALKPRNPI